MESAGVDTAMMDVIGAEETIRDVYHLDRPVEDFEATLAALCVDHDGGRAAHRHRPALRPHPRRGARARHRRAPRRPFAGAGRVMPFYARPGTFATPATATSGASSSRRARRLPDRHGAARLRAPAGHAQARDRRLRRDGGARRHRLSRRRRGRAWPRRSAGRRAAARLLLDQDRRQRDAPTRRACGAERRMRMRRPGRVGLGPAGARAAAAAARPARA